MDELFDTELTLKLSKTICKECRGDSWRGEDDHSWFAFGHVACKRAIDTGEAYLRSVFRDQPEGCLFRAEHAVLSQRGLDEQTK